MLASSGAVLASSAFLSSGFIFIGGVVMALASGTRVQLKYQTETEVGVPDAPAMTVLRATGRSINATPGSIRSNEVRADRQQIAARQGFNQVVGAPGFELSMGAYDDFILAAMAAPSWDTVATAANQNISIVAGVFVRTLGSFITDGFEVGMQVTPSGYTNNVNNQKGTIVSISSATSMTIKPLGSAYIGEAGSDNEAITMVGTVCKIGSTMTTFTVERSFLDIDQHQLFKGVTVNQMSLQVQAQNMVGGTFDLLGMSATAMTATEFDGAPAPAATNDPFTAFEGAVFAGSTTAPGMSEQQVVTALSFTLNNNRSLQPVVGSKFSPGVFEGTAAISGEATIFLENSTLYNQFFNEDTSALAVRLDDNSDFMNFGFPSLRFLSGDMDPPQQGPVPLKLPFEAQPHTLTGCSMFVQKT